MWQIKTITNMKTHRIQTLTALLLASIMMVGCFGNGGGNNRGGKGLTGRASGDMSAYEKSEVNAIEQARPLKSWLFLQTKS